VIAALTGSLAHITEVLEIILPTGCANLPDTIFER